MARKLIRIPFRVVGIEQNGFHPLVEGEVEGVPCCFIVDTGASRTVVDNGLVAQLPTLPDTQGEPFAAGVNGETMAVEQVEIPHVKLGDVWFEGMQVFCSDLSAISKIYSEMAGEQIHGLLGCDFLEDRKAVMDFRRREIRF